MNEQGSAHSEGVTAMRHALTLGVSLVVGLGLGMLVRIFVPRSLGPAGFGQFRFAESAAEMVFVLLTLGVDTVIRREVSASPDGAVRYMWGLTIIRMAAGVATVLFGTILLHSLGSTTQAVEIFAVIASAQILIVLNNSYSAVHHGIGDMRWIARTSIAFKALWAAIALAALIAVPSGISLAIALLIAEIARFAFLTAHFARRHPWAGRPDFQIAFTAIAASVPFFLNYLAHSVYARSGNWFLAFAAGPREVGLFGAASNVAAVTLVVMPIISWVLVPAAAKAGLRSQNATELLVGGALRMALVISVPIALVTFLAAPEIVQLLFGSEYTAGVGALRMLAPTVVLAYVSTISAIGLVQSNRIRTVAVVSGGGLVLNTVLNLMLLRHGVVSLVPGAAATAAATSTLLTELVVTTILLFLAWNPAWKPILLRTTAGLAAAGACAAAITLSAPFNAALTALLSTTIFCSALFATRVVGASDLLFFRRVIGGRGNHVPQLS